MPYPNSHRSTFLCERCGALRRRQSAPGLLGQASPAWPRCCKHPMLIVRKAHAEAATKLAKSRRLDWIRRGMHVFRRPGRRWTGALTPGQIARAAEQRNVHARHQC
jgi:hypothetical protein